MQHPILWVLNINRFCYCLDLIIIKTLHPQLPPKTLNYKENLLNLSTGVKSVKNRKELGSFFQTWSKADFISKQFAIGLISLHGLYKQGVCRKGLFIPNYFIILVSSMSCIPFSNKESEWLPGEQILPLPGFLSKPLAQVVKEGSPGCARNKRAPTLNLCYPNPVSGH